MKNLSVAVALVGLLCAGAGLQAVAAPAAEAGKAGASKQAAEKSQAPGKEKAAENAQAPNAEQAKVDSIVAQIVAAAKTGDSQLVTKLLSAAVQNNPQIAAKIVAGFAASQPSGKQVAAKGAAAPAIDVTAIINQVAANLQGKPGGEALAASVLGAVTTAAGANAGQSNNNANQGNPNANRGNNEKPAVPALPGAATGNRGGELPIENKSRVSPN